MQFIIKPLLLFTLLSTLTSSDLFSETLNRAEKNQSENYEYQDYGDYDDDSDDDDDEDDDNDGYYLIDDPQDDPFSLNTHRPKMKFPDKWILKSALNNAPQILQGIISYLQLRGIIVGNSDFEDPIVVPSCHRFILVGPPGSGKTTLAYAIAKSIGCYNVRYIPATSFFGDYRNQTAINISRKLKELTANQQDVVIIIDELHKIFEHHKSKNSDDSQTAAAFWLALDEIQNQNPHAIIIGTANNVDKLPPEIKSRFVGKIISIPMPDKKQKIDAFAEMISNDKRIIMKERVDRRFLQEITDRMPNNCSLRDLQLLIDTAKMIYYSENPTQQMLKDKGGYGNFIDTVDVNSIILTKNHFRQALNHLRTQSGLATESWFESEQFSKKLQNLAAVLSITINVVGLTHLSHSFILNAFTQASHLFNRLGIIHHA